MFSKLLNSTNLIKPTRPRFRLSRENFCSRQKVTSGWVSYYMYMFILTNLDAFKNFNRFQQYSCPYTCNWTKSTTNTQPTLDFISSQIYNLLHLNKYGDFRKHRHLTVPSNDDLMPSPQVNPNPSVFTQTGDKICKKK